MLSWSASTRKANEIECHSRCTWRTILTISNWERSQNHMSKSNEGWEFCLVGFVCFSAPKEANELIKEMNCHISIHVCGFHMHKKGVGCPSCCYIYISEKLLAYTWFVVMTHFGMNFFCIKETIQNYVASRAKSAVYENVHLDGSFRNFHGKTYFS